jgi:hypothetical protein
MFDALYFSGTVYLACFACTARHCNHLLNTVKIQCARKGLPGNICSGIPLIVRQRTFAYDNAGIIAQYAICLTTISIRAYTIARTATFAERGGDLGMIITIACDVTRVSVWKKRIRTSKCVFRRFGNF